MTRAAAPPGDPAEGATEPPVWGLGRLAARSTVYLAADVFARGLGLLLLPLYTRFLTPADYGVVAVVVTVGILLGIVFGLALHGAVSRMYFEAGTLHERQALFGTVLLFLAVAGALGAITVEVIGATGALDVFQGVGYDPYLRYAVWSAYAGLFVELVLAIYVVQEQPRRVATLTAANAVVTAIFTVTFVVLLEQGAIGALRAILLTNVVMGLTAFLMVRRMSRMTLSHRILVGALAFSLPLIPHALSQWLLHISDRLILERYVTQAEVGRYALAATVAGIGLLVSTALARAFAPPMTRQLKQVSGERHAARLGTWWVGMLAWSAVAVAALGDDLIRILTPQRFHSATRVVPWLVLGYLALGLYNVVSQPMWFAMKTRLLPVFTAIAASVNVGLNLLLVPRYGIEAAGWTTAIGFGLLALLVGRHAQRLHPVPWEYGYWLRLAAVGAAVVAAAYSLGGEQFLDMLAQFVLVAFAFPLTLALLGFMTHDERQRARAAVQLRGRVG